MLKAFTDLNHRFQTLIHHSSISLKLKHNSRNSIPIADYSQHIIQPNRARLQSLHLVQHWTNRHRFDHVIFDASFTRLESLTIYYISVDQLLTTCFTLHALPRLYSLYLHPDIDQQKYSVEIGKIFVFILSLPVLKRCAILNEVIWQENVPNIVLPIAINSKSSSIEYLKIDYAPPPETLVSLLDHLPSLCHLECRFFGEFNVITNELKNINLPYLKRISLQIQSVEFNQIEALMKSIGHHVEVFKSSYSRVTRYLDDKRWQNMIETYLPRLKVFDMRAEEIQLSEFRSIHNLIGPFLSSFWTEHKWFPNVSLDHFWSTFHIHPYKWDDRYTIDFH